MSETAQPESPPFRAGRVMLAGWTNVGKSTLLNRLLGEKLAAVSPVAQTTRHRLLGVRNVDGRGQIVLVDTPGLHRPRSRMNRAMMDQVGRTFRDVDLVLLLVDAARGPGPGDREAMERLRRSGTPAVGVLNKVDLVRPKTGLLPMMQQLIEEWGLLEVVPVSALTGEGCDTLVERVLARLPEGPALYEPDFWTDQPARSIAAEWIREKLLAMTRQELPHAMAVLIERWNEREDGLIEIEAGVLVDRDSQKQIVIGKGGGVLKEVGTRARVELEELLERRVFLRLWVRTRRDWRNDEQVLRELGLEG